MRMGSLPLMNALGPNQARASAQSGYGKGERL